MEINGTQNIAAPRQQVWDALNDPVILKQCLPGCESVERASPEEFRVIMAAAIGPLRARFSGTLHMTEARPPESCLMTFEGQGGVVGFGKGSSSVSLVETAEGTTLNYTANAQVGGKLAQVGSRLIDSVARKMADDFFAGLRRQLVHVEPAADAAKDAKPSFALSSTTDASPDTLTAPASLGGVAAAELPPTASAVTTAHDPHRPPTVLVPAWWLAVATVLGVAASLAGVIVAR
ncbi:MAG: carbon monoxide dehydrogenase [Hyphomicrobiales bacterium]|nr:MAG: carbon monoxide dehydrogenase [Hyphomicrobiales bacterium]